MLCYVTTTILSRNNTLPVLTLLLQYLKIALSLHNQIRSPKKTTTKTSFTYVTYDTDNVVGNWTSEVSPTLGCSIEISRDIYIFMCLSWFKMHTQNYVAKHAHAQDQFGAVKTDQ